MKEHDLISEEEAILIIKRIKLTCNAHGDCDGDKCPFRRSDIDDYDSYCILGGDDVPGEIDIEGLINRRA